MHTGGLPPLIVAHKIIFSVEAGIATAGAVREKDSVPPQPLYTKMTFPTAWGTELSEKEVIDEQDVAWTKCPASYKIEPPPEYA